jgi:hypothetical protein
MGGLTAWVDYYQQIDPDEVSRIHQLALEELMLAQFNGITLKNHLATLVDEYQITYIMGLCADQYHMEYLDNVNIIRQTE